LLRIDVASVVEPAPESQRTLSLFFLKPEPHQSVPVLVFKFFTVLYYKSKERSRGHEPKQQIFAIHLREPDSEPQLNDAAPQQCMLLFEIIKLPFKEVLLLFRS
jgi:hypothetical protein